MDKRDKFDVICQFLVGILITKPPKESKVWDIYISYINRNLDLFENEFGTREITEINKLLIEMAKARLADL